MTHLKKVLWLLVGSAIPLFFIGLWANDVRQDRKHSVMVNGPTPIFSGGGDEDCDARNELTKAMQGAEFRVRRIRYWKNCATLDVTIPDGRKGYVVLGVGNVSVNPPLR